MRRLAAEEVRDSILAVNNSLNKAQFGPPVYPTIPPRCLPARACPAPVGQVVARGAGPAQRLRPCETLALRPVLASFDAADTDATCPVRFATTQPTQALSLLNSAFTQEQAQIFADHLQKQAPGDPARQVRIGLWRVLQRPPTDKEIARGLQLIRSLQTDPALTDHDALRLYCVVLLNLNEFIYLD
jgi:hypothetical protein